MKVTTSHLTELKIPHLEAFDLDPKLGLACLSADGDNVAVFLNNRLLRSWRDSSRPKFFKIKWFGHEQVVVCGPGYSTAIVSATNWRELEKSRPDLFVLSGNYIFIGYGEEDSGSALINDPARHGVSIRSRDGRFELGFEEFFSKDREANFLQAEAAYSVGDHFVFIIYPSDRLWIFNTPARTYRSIPAPFSLVCIHVVSGDDKNAYAIFDNRHLIKLGYEREAPPFELAVFDLVAGTAVKQSFAPVEAALAAAGFDPNEIKLQLNARGRIIVSDEKKAALLEFSADEEESSDPA